MSILQPPRLTARTLRRWALTVWIGAVVVSPLQAEPVKMTLLAPEQPDSLFWSETVRFMQAVAGDLGVEFDVVASKGASTYAIRKDGLSIINRDEPPDYILTGYWNKSVERLLQASADKDVRFFLFNAPVSDTHKSRVQLPRQRFKHWIGQIMPDETRAGYALGRILLDRAGQLKTNTGREHVEAAGLAGDELSTVSDAREAGLQRAVQDAGARLNAVIDTSWQRDGAAKAARDILGRHPQTTAIWTVADGLALGVIDVLREKGLEPGVDAVTGGFDWSREGIEAVRRGEMVATMGGHFIQGGWAMLLAYDYHHGKDFAGELGSSITAPMQMITADNAAHYAALIYNSDIERIDFSRLSKTHNPGLDEYDFSLDNLLPHLDR